MTAVFRFASSSRQSPADKFKPRKDESPHAYACRLAAINAAQKSEEGPHLGADEKRFFEQALRVFHQNYGKTATVASKMDEGSFMAFIENRRIDRSEHQAIAIKSAPLKRPSTPLGRGATGHTAVKI